MKNSIIVFAILLGYSSVFSQNVGIGTLTPAARLHVADSAVVFTGSAIFSPNTSFGPPISGQGTRMLWYPQKAAWRAGYVTDVAWNKENIGDFSFATNFNNLASGSASSSFGVQTSAIGGGSVSFGNSTVALGYGSASFGVENTSIGFYSFSMGNYTRANGTGSISMGDSTNAIGDYSLCMGHRTISDGFASTAMGLSTISKADYSLVVGKYNDVTTSGALFEVGNGTASSRSNAITVLENGNVGIGIINPSNLLSFAAVGGKKISLYPGGTGDAGMGIFPNEFRQYSDNPNADITFGYDSYSTGFSEKVRFKANGMVGIGTSTPALSAGGSGLVAQNNTYIQLRVQSSASAAGLEFKPSTGNQYEIQADNSNNWFVYNRNANAYRLFINGSGFVGIGTNNPTQALQVIGNILASGTITPSDIRYKKNIQLIESPLEKLKQLNGVTYEYRKDDFPQMGFSDMEQVGLIAQEVEKVFPQLVVTDDKGYKAVDYVKLVPVLIESTKAQQSQIDKQQQQIEELQKLVKQLMHSKTGE